MKIISVKYILFILSIAIISISTIQTSSADTGYVSDMLILSLKEGPGRQFNTLRTLRSNTPVEIIETSDRFLKVKTEEGDIGWVESQYITHEFPKSIVIEQLKAQIAKMEEKAGTATSSGTAEGEQVQNQQAGPASLSSEKELEYTNKIKSLETALKAQLEKNRELESKLSTQKVQPQDNGEESGIKEEDIAENGTVKETEDTGDENSLFSGKNLMVIPEDDLLKTAMIKWFCAGAGVLIAGWFIGRTFTGGRRHGGGLLD